MIIRNFLKNINVTPSTETFSPLAGTLELSDIENASGMNVTAETSKTIATAYRCINIISDDVAKMPFQTFQVRQPGQVERFAPSSRMQNVSWLLEISPNRWMTPPSTAQCCTRPSPAGARTSR